tara:strand:- start:231 stop:341 length:111 start_codon:yes stop_codon:yes gene_type:complete
MGYARRFDPAIAAGSSFEQGELYTPDMAIARKKRGG